MYLPQHFHEDRPEVMHGLMRDYPLATLVTTGAAGLEANHVPLLLDAQAGENGVLRGHLARGNSVWRRIDPAAEALAVFIGPDAYVTPSWYPSKKAHGKVVPTWNYAAVHVHGRLRAIDEPAWLRSLLDDLTDAQERDRPVPWAIDDAPADFTDKMIRAVVGIELTITRLEGKWKVSQNRDPVDRSGVARGLRLEGDSDAMADLVDPD